MFSRQVRWQGIPYERGIHLVLESLNHAKQGINPQYTAQMRPIQGFISIMEHVLSKMRQIESVLLPRLEKLFRLRCRHPEALFVAFTLDSTNSPVNQAIAHLPVLSARSPLSLQDLTRCGDLGGRLAFMGDVVLKYHVSIQLWSDPTLETKENLTDKRKNIESNENLSRCFDALDLGKYIIENPDQPAKLKDETKGRVVEAILAVFFICHGLGKPTRSFIEFIKNTVPAS